MTIEVTGRELIQFAIIYLVLSFIGGFLSAWAKDLSAGLKRVLHRRALVRKAKRMLKGLDE